MAFNLPFYEEVTRFNCFIQRNYEHIYIPQAHNFREIKISSQSTNVHKSVATAKTEMFPLNIVFIWGNFKLLNLPVIGNWFNLFQTKFSGFLNHHLFLVLLSITDFLLIFCRWFKRWQKGVWEQYIAQLVSWHQTLMKTVICMTISR